MHLPGTAVLVEGTARRRPEEGRVLDVPSERRELEGEVEWGHGLLAESLSPRGRLF